MADQASLRLIGLAFSAVTAAVMLMAAVAMTNVDRGIVERPAAALVTTTG
jgi:hypothetical protein